MNSPEIAPPDFWPEVLALDHQMHINSPEQEKKLFRHNAKDIWGHRSPVDQHGDDELFMFESRARVASWEGTRTLGTYSVQGALLVIQPVEQTPVSDASHFPVLETKYVYYSVRERPHLSGLVVFITAGDLKQATPPEVIKERATEGKKALEMGLLNPTAEQYNDFLGEMRRGASGNHRSIA